MPRNFGPIYTSIWADGPFLALPSGAQRLYMFLITQADIMPTGVLPLRMRRWAGKAAGLKPSEVEADVEILASARFVVVDYDTEELLVRSFVRRSEVWKQPNIMCKLPELVDAIESTMLRDALATELMRLDPAALPTSRPKTGPTARTAVEMVLVTILGELPARYQRPEQGVLVDVSDPMSDGVPDGVPDGVRDGVRDGVGDGAQDGVQDGVADGVGDGVGDGLHARRRGRVTKNLELKELTTSVKPSDVGSDDDPSFVAFWRAYPRKTAKDAARKSWRTAVLTKRTDPSVLIAAATAFAAARSGEDPQYTPHPATWLNQGRWADEPDPEVASEAQAARRRWGDPRV